MLLYDELKAAAEPIPDDVAIFEISNVEKFCRDAKEWDDWGLEELQKTADMFPPFDNFWMEWRTPRGGFQGVSFNCLKLKNYGWDCIANFYIKDHTGKIGSNAGTEFHISEQGTWDSEEPFECQNELAVGFLLPCFQALMFMSMHEKSVRIVENIPPRPERRRAAREGKPQPVTYKTLVIRGVSTNPKRNNESDSQGGYAFHICRGHRRKYTEDGPLFGKYVGTFWIPAHTRGSEEHGKVEKTYRVEPPIDFGEQGA